MKKAKIVLSAVALLAVVGGAVAFKASRIPVTIYTNNEDGQCKVPLQAAYTTLNPTTVGTFSFSSTLLACPVQSYRIAE